MKRLLGLSLIFFVYAGATAADPRPGGARYTSAPSKGLASWYGESHRGKLMANGKPFNPDRLTAASWFYPLGTELRVTLDAPELIGRKAPPRSVIVTITDRGPARRLVRDGRIIDLTHAAFKAIADPDLGLVRVTVAELPLANEPVTAAASSSPAGTRS